MSPRLRTLVTTGVAAAALVAPVVPAAQASPAAVDVARLATSSAAPSMTWTQIHDRMMTWVDNDAITYSQSGTYPGPDGELYRRDCSGFVSMALHLPSTGGGPNTVDMTQYVHRISYDELQPGDLLGRLGSGSAGDNGHVRIFVDWLDENHLQAYVAEQGWTHDPNYPHISVRPVREYLDNGDELLPYRYNGKV